MPYGERLYTCMCCLQTIRCGDAIPSVCPDCEDHYDPNDFHKKCPIEHLKPLGYGADYDAYLRNSVRRLIRRGNKIREMGL